MLSAIQCEIDHDGGGSDRGHGRGNKLPRHPSVMEVKIPIFPKVRKILFFTLSPFWGDGINALGLTMRCGSAPWPMRLRCYESRKGKSVAGW